MFVSKHSICLICSPGYRGMSCRENTFAAAATVDIIACWCSVKLVADLWISHWISNMALIFGKLTFGHQTFDMIGTRDNGWAYALLMLINYDFNRIMFHFVLHHICITMYTHICYIFKLPLTNFVNFWNI